MTARFDLPRHTSHRGVILFTVQAPTDAQPTVSVYRRRFELMCSMITLDWHHIACLPDEVIAGSGTTVTGAVHMDSHYLLSDCPHSLWSQALIREHNGLSQFNEDTGKSSVPVREFDLIAFPLASSSWKTPFQTWNWTQASNSHQPVSPAGTVAY